MIEDRGSRIEDRVIARMTTRELLSSIRDPRIRDLRG